VATSAAEADYMALSSACKEVMIMERNNVKESREKTNNTCCLQRQHIGNSVCKVGRD